MHFRELAMDAEELGIGKENALVRKGWTLLVTSAGGTGITRGSVPVVKGKAKEKEERNKREKEKDGKKAKVKAKQDQDGEKEKEQE